MTLRALAILADAAPPEAWYRGHVGAAGPCGCNLDGPDRSCDVGESLWRVQQQTPWEVRRRAWARSRGLLAPWE